jgi:hypothetical protein
VLTLGDAASGGIGGTNSAGNLHLDSDASKSDGRIYLNYYNGKGVAFGNGAPAAIDNAGNFNTSGIVSAGTAGPCCSGLITLSAAENTVNNGRLATIQFHNSGAAEGQIVLTEGGRQPNGVAAPASFARRTLVLQSVQDRMDLYVTGDIRAGGSKFFVHPHPKDAKRVIEYISLEGGEAGTYVRGSARLERGRAVLDLPEHFGLVTSPEALTAQVTARERCGPLYVETVTPERLLVRAESPHAACRFDWLVQGKRLGHERHEPIAAR